MTDLRAIAEAATPGPWWALHVAGTGEPGAFCLISSNGVRDTDINPANEADAAHIASWNPRRALAALDVAEAGADFIDELDAGGQGFELAVCRLRAAIARWEALR